MVMRTLYAGPIPTAAELADDVAMMIEQAKINWDLMITNYAELQKRDGGEGIVTAAAMVVMAQSRHNTLVEVWELIAARHWDVLNDPRLAPVV